MKQKHQLIRASLTHRIMTYDKMSRLPPYAVTDKRLAIWKQRVVRSHFTGGNTKFRERS